MVLRRLLDPLHEVLDYLGAVNSIKRKHTIRTTVICLLIKAMHQEQKSYWGFSTELWHTILGSDYYAYVRHHGVTANARQQLVAIAYLIGGFNQLSALGRLSYYALACKIFTQVVIDNSVDSITSKLSDWGYSKQGNQVAVRVALCEVLLAQRSPCIKQITYERLFQCHKLAKAKITRRGLTLISMALARLSLIPYPLGQTEKPNWDEFIQHGKAIKDVPPCWLSWCGRWFSTSTLQYSSRVSALYRLFQAGRWFAHHYPNLESPADWNRDIACAYVAAINHAKIGQWSTSHGLQSKQAMQPLSPGAKEAILKSVVLSFSIVKHGVGFL